MGFLYTGWSVTNTGWDVSKRDGVLVYGMGCYFPGWGATRLLTSTGWSVSIRDGVLVNGMGC